MGAQLRKTFRVTAMALTFAVVAANCILWDLTSGYVAVVLALVASFATGRYIERVFIKRGYRELVLLYGADWNVTDEGG